MRRAPRTTNDAGRRDAFVAAIDAMPAEALRAFLRDWHAALDRAPQLAFEDAAVTHAARTDTSWRPPTRDPHLHIELGSFVRLARLRGDAEPGDVDDFLSRIGRLFLAGDLATAREAYRTLIEPLAVADIHLGQDELLDDVLQTSLDEVAGRYLVAVYETTTPEERPAALWRALEFIAGLASVSRPIACMERAAFHRLSDLAEFLPRWQAHIHALTPWPSDWNFKYTVEEAIARSEGVQGLARYAEETGDFDPFLRSLADAQRWPEYLSAAKRAAERTGEPRHAADLHDDAAVVAAHLGRDEDVTLHLDRALRVRPTAARLLRHLSHGDTHPEFLTTRVRALLAAPLSLHFDLRGVLLLLLGEYTEACSLLTTKDAVRRLGSEHSPGLLVLAALHVAGGAPPSGSVRGELCRPLTEPFENSFSRPGDLPPVPQRTLAEFLDPRRTRRSPSSSDQSIMLGALCDAVVALVQGVIRDKHRSRYELGAALMVACLELGWILERAPTVESWFQQHRAATSRYPAFQSRLRDRLDRAQASRTAPAMTLP